MKTLSQYIKESIEHTWANPSMNKKELMEFDNTQSLAEKIYIGCNIIAKNHKHEIDCDFLPSYGDMRIKIYDGNNVPTITDLEMLHKELNKKFDINYAKGNVQHYLKDDVYVSFRASKQIDKDFINKMEDED